MKIPQFSLGNNQDKLIKVESSLKLGKQNKEKNK